MKGYIKKFEKCSKKKWDLTLPEYKSIIDGQHFILTYDSRLGTILAPVEIVDSLK
tara:strand:+ start:264 stop:428 length:165 start_codon:yes stop_codon:yes gene_type:complete